MSIWRVNEVFLNLQAGTRQKLPKQEIGKNGRNMRRIAMFVHHSELTGQQELEPCSERINIRCGDDRHTVLCEQPSDVSQKPYRAFDVLDHLDRKYQIKSPDTQGLGE